MTTTLKRLEEIKANVEIDHNRCGNDEDVRWLLALARTGVELAESLERADLVFNGAAGVEKALAAFRAQEAT